MDCHFILDSVQAELFGWLNFALQPTFTSRTTHCRFNWQDNGRHKPKKISAIVRKICIHFYNEFNGNNNNNNYTYFSKMGLNQHSKYPSYGDGHEQKNVKKQKKEFLKRILLNAHNITPATK